MPVALVAAAQFSKVKRDVVSGTSKLTSLAQESRAVGRASERTNVAPPAKVNAINRAELEALVYISCTLFRL